MSALGVVFNNESVPYDEPLLAELPSLVNRSLQVETYKVIMCRV